MANILYGVNGERSGHSTRAKEIITHLQGQGHRVHVVSFDRGLRNLKSEFEVTEIYGLRLAYVRNRVRYRKTIIGNLLKAPRAARSIKELTRLAEQWAIELVITDFEPLSCRLAHHQRLPVISIDNQHLLTRAEISYPRECRNDAAAAKLVTRVMTHGCDAYLIISFFEASLRRKDTFLFPPILRQEVLQAPATTGEYVLVYVTSPSAELVDLLRRIRQRFVCYGFEAEGEEGNLLFRKPQPGRFFGGPGGVQGGAGQLRIFADQRSPAPAQALPGLAAKAAVRAGVQRLLHPEDGLRGLVGRFEQGAYRIIPVQPGGVPRKSGQLSGAGQFAHFRQAG